MPYLWVLVEWVDESNVVPSYGVVNVDPMMYNDNDLNPGRVIMVRLPHEMTPKRGQILTVSESKHHVKSHKKLLERQDNQMKNVITMCMQTIKGMQSEPVYMPGGLGGMNMNMTHSIVHPRIGPSKPPVVLVTPESGDSSSDNEDIMPNRNLNPYYSKPTPVLPPLVRRMDAIKPGHSSMSMQHVERPVMSSTPLPSYKEEMKLMFDQATQTENKQLEQLEKRLRSMYARFLALTARLEIHKATNSNAIDRQTMARIQANIDENQIDQVVNNMTIDQILNDFGPSLEMTDRMVSPIADQNMDTTGVLEDDAETSDVRTLRTNNSSNSGQSENSMERVTPNNDMVPLGSGHAEVPRTVMNQIDWNSYTSATRQLLQAIFSRRTLATHSLTGKQSPAFQDKPAKKILDPKLVEDIVTAVSERCGVDKRLVRNIITVKCTDEAKLYRNRQRRRLTRSAARQNQENVPPSGTSSTDSSLATVD